MQDITIQLFGAFRPLGSIMALQVPKGASVHDVRMAFLGHLPEGLRDLLEVSRFADERTVLAENAIVIENSTLAILPPVSGG
ncbi:MAG: molybdopterin converting factor [Robiginitomaculum sp.]|nr:MAG: molybdopterin converting factor [Robiginitomaculum sp.]